MESLFVTLAEVQWTPEECGPVPVHTEDTFCCQGFLRSRKVCSASAVREDFHIHLGPQCSRTSSSAKAIFLELLDTETVNTFCKQLNAQGCKRWQNKRVTGQDFLALTAVALQGGFHKGLRINGLTDSVNKMEKLRQSLPQVQGLPLLLDDLKDEEVFWVAVQNLLETTRKNFQKACTPGQNLSIKKFELRSKGQHTMSELRVAVLFEMAHGFVCNFFFYSASCLPRGTDSPPVLHILYELLQPYYSKAYHVQLDHSAYSDGRLADSFARLGIKLNFTSFCPRLEKTPEEVNSSFTDSQTALWYPFLEGWVWPALVPPSPETHLDPFLMLWLGVHLVCVDAFVLGSVTQHGTIGEMSLCDFSHSLSAQLANECVSEEPFIAGLTLHNLKDSSGRNRGSIREKLEMRNRGSYYWGDKEEAGMHRKAGKGPPHGSVGLTNLGNSCYINAVLQCLSYTTPLLQELLCEEKWPDQPSQRTDVTRAVVTLLADMWTGHLEQRTLHESVSFIKQMHPQFTNSRQQDAQELLLCLMNALHEDLKKTRSRSHSRFESGKSSTEEPKEFSIITQLFEGLLSYDMICLICDHQILTNEVFTILSLPIPANTKECSVQDCLELFFQPNALQQGDQIFCPQCEEKQDAAVLTTLSKSPQILILHLKRFQYRGKKKQKLNTYVKFVVETLDLSPYLTTRTNSQYFLYAVVNHIGDLDNGHYTAYCRDPFTKHWHQYDDEIESDIKEDFVQSPQAYLLFYSTENLPVPCLHF
ncbi:uncharacterized protein LOC114667980 [Erpetoichthys calabaricus]|nr:uncharacterized protein LOC114667980 [Erpetoichthys calabaricus]